MPTRVSRDRLAAKQALRYASRVTSAVPERFRSISYLEPGRSVIPAYLRSTSTPALVQAALGRAPVKRALRDA